MLDLVWLIPALPLAGFLCLLLFGRKLGDPRAGLSLIHISEPTRPY